MSTVHCEVAVVGAGTAGLAAERTAREAGATTLLIDERFAGTTCATSGCMPSKLLIAAAGAAHAVRQASRFGVVAGPMTVDGAAVMQRVRAERDRFVAGVQKQIAALPAHLRIQSRARFENRTTLKLEDGREVRAKAIVIATGSRSTVPSALKGLGARILTNETIFELPELPRSVAVVGAGPLGLELAQALARLGVGVQVFDESPHLAAIQDKAVETYLLAHLGPALSITLGVRLEASAVEGGIDVRWTGASHGARRFEFMLVAAGRPPALDALNLTATGVALDEHGSPAYDPATLQCDGSSIFIAGDAAHDRPVLHEAAAEGIIAGKNAARFPALLRAERFVPLSIMFTDPQLAMVGVMAKDGAAANVLGCASYEDQGRARAFARNSGLVHLYADATHGHLSGATLFGPEVEHSAHLLAWAIQKKMTADEILKMPFYHPTYQEGLKPALRAICKQVKSPPDDGISPGE